MVKSRKAKQLIANLKETFLNLWANQIRLNGVPLGKLLHFIMSKLGIEANPKKIFAVMSMESIKNLKGAQRLMRCLAMLSCFISRLGVRRTPLHMLLKKYEQF